MAAAQRGEAAPYRRLLDQLRPWLQCYFRRRLPPAMVDEVVQETMISIHEKRHTYDVSSPFEAWLAAIARYKWIGRLRAMKRSSSEEIDETISIGDHHDAVASATILEALLGELKPERSQVIRLVKIDGLSIEEAAARSGQSESLVKVNIRRGLAKMAASAARVERSKALVS